MSFQQQLFAEALAENKENTKPNTTADTADGHRSTFKIVVDEHDEKEVHKSRGSNVKTPSSTSTPSTEQPVKRRKHRGHQRSTSRSLSHKSPGITGTLPGIDETKNVEKVVMNGDTHGDGDGMEDKERRNSRSTIKSLQKIKEYGGNEDINHLRKLYKQQHKMKQKLQRLRNRSLMSFPAPPKPTDIESFLDDKTRYFK